MMYAGGRAEISQLKWTLQLLPGDFSSQSLLADLLEASALSSLVALEALDLRLTISGRLAKTLASAH